MCPKPSGVHTRSTMCPEPAGVHAGSTMCPKCPGVTLTQLCVPNVQGSRSLNYMSQTTGGFACSTVCPEPLGVRVRLTMCLECSGFTFAQPYVPNVRGFRSLDCVSRTVLVSRSFNFVTQQVWSSWLSTLNYMSQTVRGLRLPKLMSRTVRGSRSFNYVSGASGVLTRLNVCPELSGVHARSTMCPKLSGSHAHSTMCH